jgi:2-dehydro-3-deoxygluconokinase
MKRVASIGECMIELRHRDAALLELGFAGDSFNTALYLARLSAGLAVDYVTALGDDPYSEAMLDSWRAEGIGTDAVTRLPGKLPGLYLIRTAADGERRFFYYRSAAAARELFRDAEASILRRLHQYDVLYFTAITLSILAPDARERLHAVLAAARAAGQLVVFDSNYRPAGWPDRATAQTAIEPFLDVIGMALPTFEDEQALWGDKVPHETRARYSTRGVEVCVKRGAEGCDLGSGTHVPVPVPIAPIDTTAAGDAFNAAYLSARLAGAAPAEAALAGHCLAGVVIQYRGAIIPRAAMPSIVL